MNKNKISFLVAVILISGSLYISGAFDGLRANITPDESPSTEMGAFIDCLAENELVIFGSEWCPACGQLADSLGGYDAIDSIYVECTESGSEEERERCKEEAKTGYVPEIQIEGEVYEGPRDPESLGEVVGCSL